MVSVLMTAYNREKYIAEAIESVLASCFKDFELIIVDDCSKDHTVEIARRYTSDPRVQVHVNEKNLGDYPNRNRAASFARGKYLKYLDSDDVIYPHGLEVMVSSMERFPEAVLGLIRSPRRDAPDPEQISPKEAYVEHFLKGGFLDAGPSGTIIQTSAFHALGGFSGKRFVGDTEMWLRLAARWPVVRLVQGLVWWRQHEQQEFRSDPRFSSLGYSSAGYLEWNYRVSVASLMQPECPLSAEEKGRVLSSLKRAQVRVLLRLFFQLRQPVEALRIMRSSDLSLADMLHAWA
jgi:glycosyltransferase involved in cell wall biosynthesis